MQFQKQINISETTTPYQYRTKEYFHPKNVMMRQVPKIYKEELYYQYKANPYQIHSAKDTERQFEINNEENPSSKRYTIRKEVNSINKRHPSALLLNERPLNSSLKNFKKFIREENEPNLKKINIGEIRKNIETNHRNINIRKSPEIIRKIAKRRTEFNNYYNNNSNYFNNNSYNNNQGNLIRYRNSSYDVNRNYYVVHNSGRDSPMNYMERSGNKVIDRVSDGFNASGYLPTYDERLTTYNDELNVSNDYENNSSDNRKNTIDFRDRDNIDYDYDYDYRQNRFENMNQMNNQTDNYQRIRNLNDYYNYSHITNNEYQPHTTNIRSPPNILNNNLIGFIPRPSYNKRYIKNNNNNINNRKYIRDDIQEKYKNQSHNNMTYKEVKNIVKKFTKVYDPKKNNKGILIENSQVIVPGAEDEVFHNRYRVLTKMRRLSNILLAQQNNKRKTVANKNQIEEFFNKINANKINENDKENNSDNEINIKSFNNLHQINKKSIISLKDLYQKAKSKSKSKNKFKYLYLAMLSSKGRNTENRIFQRKMRLEKGGVVDLASQLEKTKGKYKIRKASKSPGYNITYYKKSTKYKVIAAKKVQAWWRKIRALMNKKIEKIILIQSIYRGRFVRKYLYDLLYLNYLYLSFCQKIEMVLKKVIKPYIFNLLKNYGKSKLIKKLEDIKNFDKLKNIIASKEKKWRIINLRKGMNKLREYLFKQNKINLALYKLLKIKAEKNNNENIIIKNALRKWDYLTKIIKIKLEQDTLDKNRINKVIKNQNDKIKGLFNIINGIHTYAKKSALEHTLQKIIKYLNEQKIKLILTKLINKKANYDKEKLKIYFYKYIKSTLEFLHEKEKEEIENLKLKGNLHKKNPSMNIITKTENIITKAENITLPKIYKKINYKIVKGTNKMEIRGISREKKEVIYEIKNDEKIILKENEKRRDDIIKMKARLFLYLINSVNKKQNKNLLAKYFYKYFKKIIQLQREEDRRIFEEKQKEENIKRKKEEDEERKEKILLKAKRNKLKQLPKIKEKFIKNILKQYFNLWKKRTFTTKESALKLFIKILDIIIENYYKNILKEKLKQLRKNKIQENIIESPKEIQIQNEEKEFDIFNTLKNLKDIINFNDYLRNIYVNKYGKEFLDKLDKTRNPRLISKNLKKILRKKYLIESNNLIRALNKWKNQAQYEKALNILKARLIYLLYSKNKDNEQSNLLLKYFTKWKNIDIVDNIRKEIYKLKNVNNLAKGLLLKTIVRNRENLSKNILLKKCLNKWISLLKTDLQDLPKTNNVYSKFLGKILDNLSNKRLNILEEALNNIKDRNKMISLNNIFQNKNNRINYLIKRALNKWKNKAFKNKYIMLSLHKLIQKKEEKDNNKLRSILYTWLYKAMLLKIKRKEKIISDFFKDIKRKKYIISKWKYLKDLLKNRIRKNEINDIINNLKTYKYIYILFNILKHHMKKDANDLLRNNINLLLFQKKLKNICENLDAKNNDNSIKRFLNIWRNKTNKINKRLSKLNELMNLLNLKQIKDNTNTLYQTMLLKKLFNDIPRLYKYTTLNKIKDFSNNKQKNTNLANNLILAKKDLMPKLVSPLIKNLCKLYAYKLLDKLIDNINKGLIRNSDFNKNIFLGKMLLFFSDKYKDYNYSNQLEKENKPNTKKLLFKSKKNLNKNNIKDKSNLPLLLISPLVDLLSNLIKKRKKDTLDKINNNYKGEKLYQILSKYIKEKIFPYKEDFINNLQILQDKCENDGPQKVKLFKLLRKYIIKKIFIYNEDIYRMCLIFYLINLTQYNLEIAKNRWMRQIIRKWRFISFIKKMTREKMELMYKNMHSSYLEMVDSIFNDEEAKNPGVAKEFERFGNDLGMFINEDPYNDYILDGKICLGVKKQYLFPNALCIEKIGETENKIENSEVILGEKYDKYDGEIIKDKNENEKEKLEDGEEGEEKEDEKEEKNNV